MEILDSLKTQERIKTESMFDPIIKSFIKEYPPYHDILNTYTYGMENIGNIVETQVKIDDPLPTGVPNTVIKFKFCIKNVRIYGPGTLEHAEKSTFTCSAQSPNEALKRRMTYSALIIGDIYYSYQVIDMLERSKSEVTETIIPNSYIVNIPIPLYSKYCVLRNYDPLTQIRSGEDMEGMYGYFIIQGFIKFLIPYYTVPYNSPLILKNDYDNQLARAEGLYIGGLNYENSFHIIASILRPKQTHMGRGINQIPILDFVFSLQMNDTCMKQRTITRKKELINMVPIRYLFYAFGCSSDLEMLKYICPDLNDFALIHTIRQACLYGKYHIECVSKYIPCSSANGYLKFDMPLDCYTAKYLVGEMILAEEYKDKIKSKCKKSKNEIDYNAYKRELVRQVSRILLTQFMPGISKMNMNMKLYEIVDTELTDEQRLEIADQELKRNKAICYELGLIVKKLYNIGNKIEPSMDRISLTNRRIRDGEQIQNEFKAFQNARVKEVRLQVKVMCKNITSAVILKDKNALAKMFADKMQSLAGTMSSNQTASLINAFKGTVTKEKTKLRSDLIQTRNQTFLYSKLREIVAPSSSKTKGVTLSWEHRAVHPSHLYFIDAIYTPESGQQVGKYQMPCVYTFLTTGSLGTKVYNFLKKDKNFLTSVEGVEDKYIIKLNGSTIGYVMEYEPVEKMYENLLNARRDGTIEYDASIVLMHKEGELNIYTDEGRLVTIFIVVKNCFETAAGQIGIRPNFIKWLENCKNETPNQHMIKEGLKEGFIAVYDAPMVIYNGMVAQNIRDFIEKPWLYNLIALPSQSLSYVTSVAPGICLNAGVRGSYISNHMKQAMGLMIRYPQIKYMNEVNILLAPHLPLMRSTTYDVLGYNQKPMGNNVIIAFLMYCDNQEDSFILNRSSVENGIFVIDSYKVYTNECKKGDELFQMPDEKTQKIGNVDSYLKIDPNTCLPKRVGDKFYTNDVLISKIIQLDAMRKVDSSTLNDKQDGIHPREANTRELRCVSVDKEINENTHVKMVVVGQRRTALEGDKFNSCNAQKGTLGRIYDSDKMPYTRSGIRPDIIFSPLSIFSRNTCGQMYEGYAAKLCALLGCPIDATAYETLREMSELEDIYKKIGANPMGYEELFDPESGRPFGKVFIGVMHYQRQQHILEDKLNVRSINDGDFDKVSGLCVKGRKKKGGQSIDRMIVDSMNASGAEIMNQSMHIDQGAKMTIAICGICNKQYTYYSKQYKCWFCSCCGRHSNFIIKEVTPAEVLINQVFTGMHLTCEYRARTDKPDVLQDIKN